VLDRPARFDRVSEQPGDLDGSDHVSVL
jgi:hypothetical protein